MYLDSEEVELRFEDGMVHGENVMYGTRPSWKWTIQGIILGVPDCVGGCMHIHVHASVCVCACGGGG